MGNNDVNRPSRRVGLKIALVGAGLAAGVVGATALGANAGTTTSGSGTAAYSPASGSASTGANGRPAPPNGARGNGNGFDHGGSTPVRNDEKSVSSSLAAKLKAAALKAVKGGTVYRVETDAGDGTYEAHMTKADGSLVTVKFDKFGVVTKVESGMGAGDPGSHH